MIVQGTTPYHSFTLPMRAEQISELWITYSQNGEIILDKTSKDDDGNMYLLNMDDIDDNASMHEYCHHKYSQLIVHLTQEETLKFHFYPAAEKNIAVIQIRILDVDGEAYTSNPFHERIMGATKGGVLTGETD